MARKPLGPRPANLSIEAKRTAVPRLEARVRDLEQLDIASISSADDERVQSLSARIRSTLAQIYGEDTLEFARLSDAAELNLTYWVLNLAGADYSRGPTVDDLRTGLSQGRTRAISLLSGELDGHREELGLMGTATPHSRSDASSQPVVYGDDIFVVHGHDSPAKTEVARLIERAGLTAIILHEQANASRTLIQKFEDHGSASGFAVVIVTPDDVGGSDANHLRPWARQNVIGEMFWFAGKLGRTRVCALVKGDVEMPSDFVGVTYTQMDDRGAWKHELLRELRAAGYKIDWEKALA
jgi:predicted nucleotide-binding protein